MAGFVDLPEDILIQILYRLPVKSLIRLKSACKRWYNIITDPTFIAEHYSFSRKIQEEDDIVVASDTRGFTFISGQTLEATTNIRPPHITGIEYYSISLLSLHNGLLCLKYFRYLESFRGRETRIAVWNPATRQFKFLPDPSIFSTIKSMCHYEHVGFHVDLESNSYQVFRIWRTYAPRRMCLPTKVEVYDSCFGYWKKLHGIIDDVDEAIEPSSTFSFRYQTHSITLNGIIYWKGENDLKRIEYKACILYFNMASFRIGVLAVPDFVSVYRGTCLVAGSRLGIFNQSIALFICRYDDEEVHNFDIWVKNEQKLIRMITVPCGLCVVPAFLLQCRKEILVACHAPGIYVYKWDPEDEPHIILSQDTLYDRAIGTIQVPLVGVFMRDIVCAFRETLFQVC